MSDLRKPKYLSPSSLATWERDKDEYFYRYICPKEFRPERPPQTGPMSVGSAFDALVKNAIYEHYFGREKTLVDGYTRTQLIETQCEEHTLPESLVIAVDVFDQYTQCGALGDLLSLIERSPSIPKMEYDLTKVTAGVPMLGKPDLHFSTPRGSHIIVDFKVSGSCSKCGVSPQQGYQLIRSINGGRGDGQPHSKYVPADHIGGIEVSAIPMNETTDYWADQLATYAWSLGEAVGQDTFVVQIEQMACRPCPESDDSGRLRVRCATHRSTVDPVYQINLLERYQRCWEHVVRGHYFPELSRSESDARCEHLIRKAKSPVLLPPDLTGNDIPSLDFGG
jgi:hypothetical protein